MKAGVTGKAVVVMSLVVMLSIWSVPVMAEHPDDPESGYLGVMAGSLSLKIPEGFEQEFKFELPGISGGDA